tara:strand:+ start:299 stop:484 length:186 start_codon:yes stop_codon:yes gene_type:complete
MDEIIFTNPKYVKDEKTEQNIFIQATVDGQQCDIPLDEENRHYKEIKRQVDAGILTIEAAD